MQDKFNPDENFNFHIPETFLNRLYDFTGDSKGNGGFVLTYVNDEGKAVVLSKVSSDIIAMGLKKSMEQYLIMSEEDENSPFGSGDKGN